MHLSQVTSHSALSGPAAPRASAPFQEAAGAHSSRARLLDVAEDLCGRKGIEGVSLREIAAAAGQRNNSAVRYHFKDKAGLVAALMADRIARVERERQALVEAHEPLEAQAPELLLRVLWEPLLNLRNPQGSHAFIRFLLAFVVEDRGILHPIIADPANHPASGRIMQALSGCFPDVPPERFFYRLDLLAMMFWSAVSQHDQAAAATNQSWSSRFSLDETIRMSIAALGAPL